MPNASKTKYPVRLGKITLVICLCICAAAAGWGTKTLVTPPPAQDKQPEYAITTAKNGKLGRTIEVKSSARLEKIAVITAKSAGTLTTINTPKSATVNAGDTIGSINLQTIRVLPGTTPAFRELAQGTEGTDVAQLQGFLHTKYGVTATPNGRYDYQTGVLVKRWQKELGEEQTGTVPLGAVIFIPALPAQIVWEKDLLAGAEVSPGTKLLSVYGGKPQFTAKIPASAFDAINDGATATLKYKNFTWLSEIKSTRYDDDSQQWLAELQPTAGNAAICGDDCGNIPANGLNSISTQIVTVPEQDGVIVPTSAIRVDSKNRTVVIDSKGKHHPVEVKLSLSGQAIVRGLADGTKVRSWVTTDTTTGK